VDKAGQLPDTESIFRAAAEGDECARFVVNRALEHLAAALVSFLHAFDPEVLILGGNIAAAGPARRSDKRHDCSSDKDNVGPRNSDRVSKDSRLWRRCGRSRLGFPAAALASDLKNKVG
jgi:predicted NBD/HSP70 family sugar kinase